MTINCSASVLLAMYLVVAEHQNVPWHKVAGTIQNDMLAVEDTHQHKARRFAQRISQTDEEERSDDKREYR